MMFINYLKLELNLILRNVRPKLILALSISIIAFFASMVFQPPLNHSDSYIIILIPIIIVGVVAQAHGGFIIAWESEYFSLIQTLPILCYDYIKAKFMLLGLMTFVPFLISLGLLYFDYSYWRYLLCGLLFNLGIAIPILIYMGQYNNKRMNISKGTLILEGQTTGNMLSSVIVLGIVFFAFTSCKYLFNYGGIEVANIFIILGFIGICCYPIMIKHIASQISKKKYELFEGYQ